MVYTAPTQHPPNSQYDPDSAPNQSYNCGPTTVTNTVKFMRDRDFGIEATRDLGTSTNYRGTTTSQRKVMFDKRGVPASVRHMSPSEVKSALNGRKTFDIALLMSKIPLSIRKRPFPGAHSVEAIAKGELKGVPGIWVNNPDFHRDRGEASRYFYPDSAWVPAFLALGGTYLGKRGGWCVVPDKDKVISTRGNYRRKWRVIAGLNARSGPGTKYSTVKVLAAGYIFTSIQLERAGGAYTDPNGATRHDWLSFSLNGRLVWVARGFTKEVT